MGEGFEEDVVSEVGEGRSIAREADQLPGIDLLPITWRGRQHVLSL